MKKMARRLFIKKSIPAVGPIGVLPKLINCKNSNCDVAGLFVHHVLFWFKKTDDEVVLTKFRKALEHLTSIETVRYWHIGSPASTN